MGKDADGLVSGQNVRTHALMSRQISCNTRAEFLKLNRPGSLHQGERRLASRPCRRGFGSAAIPFLTIPERRHSLPEILAGPEEGRLPGGNVDRIAGSGIAPPSGMAAPCPKTPEAPQLHLVPFPQRLGNAREKDAHDGFGLPVGQLDLVGNSRSQF